MTPRKTSLSAIAIAPPMADVAEVAAQVQAEFGLAGDYVSLVSERDQNFRLTTRDRCRYVVKVTSSLEESAVTDFQIEALLHLEREQSLPLPRVVRTINGESSASIEVGGTACRLRVVEFVEGQPLAELDVTPVIVGRLGSALAALDRALEGFSHPGQNPLLLWDMQRTSEVRYLLEFIEDDMLRERVETVIDDFDARIAPGMGELRTQVIHSDANPGNVLLCESGIGFIDFGDMVRAPLVFDVAIAAAYLRAGDPLELIVPFVEAYHEALPLQKRELQLLFDLVRARLATSIALFHWRLRERDPDDEYRNKLLATERTPDVFLAALDELGRERFLAAFDQLLS
ncbi:MAG: phosphotransferase [Woeseiaceae bacterium]|nr:phosphotransferase [Woeseiaceae bacterium]